MGDNQIGNKGLSLFSKAKCPNLKQVDLDNISITSDGIDTFSRHCRLNLGCLSFHRNIANINSVRRLFFLKTRIVYFSETSKTFEIDIAKTHSLPFFNEIVKVKGIAVSSCSEWLHELYL